MCTNVSASFPQSLEKFQVELRTILRPSNLHSIALKLAYNVVKNTLAL
jgi:hypothetical protein